MEAKLKNVKITVGASKKLPDIAVILGIFFQTHKHNLKKIKCHEVGELCNGIERACITYALFELVREKLIGSPLEISKTRVSSVRCNALNGKFLLSWNTQGSLSMLRKTIGVVLSCLVPHKLYSRYVNNCKLMACKHDRPVFNKLANELSAAITKNITIAVCGKIKLTPAKLKDLLAKAYKKYPTQTSVKDVAPVPKYIEFADTFPHISATGIAAVAVAEYISSKSGGMLVSVYDKKVIVYNKSWDAKRKSLKKASRIDDYTRLKYKKLKTEFPCIFAYLAITREFADCCTVTKIIKSKPGADVVNKLLKKSLS